MNWLNTTITTDKGPIGVLINLDNVREIRQRDDGRALVIYVHGQAGTIDDSYAKIINQIVPPSDAHTRLAQHMEVLDQT